jgi:hypothetical protein
MSDNIWETFDALCKTIHRQGRRLEDLEARITDLERRLQESNPDRPAAELMQPLPASLAATNQTDAGAIG